jgi:hypothetical protein
MFVLILVMPTAFLCLEVPPVAARDCEYLLRNPPQVQRLSVSGVLPTAQPAVIRQSVVGVRPPTGGGEVQNLPNNAPAAYRWLGWSIDSCIRAVELESASQQFLLTFHRTYQSLNF